MQVNLIDYTGAGSNDLMYAAKILVYAKNTRLTQGEETRAKVNAMTKEELEAELLYISNTIRSSWEFVSYTFESLHVTRAFTHQLVRTRHGSYAQQTQRAVDMSNFEAVMPESIIQAPKSVQRVWTEAIRELRVAYSRLQQAGIPNQDCRGLIPTNGETSIIAKFNLRTLADLVAKRQNLRAQGEYADVVQRMASLVLVAHPWAKPFLYPERVQTPMVDKFMKELLGARSPTDVPEIAAALKEIDKLKGTWG